MHDSFYKKSMDISGDVCISRGNIKINSHNEMAHLMTSGSDVHINCFGDLSYIAASGDNTQIISQGYGANIILNGRYSTVCSIGNASKIQNNTDFNTIISKGDNTFISSRGNDVSIVSQRKDCCIYICGCSIKVMARKGTIITIARTKLKPHTYDTYTVEEIKTEVVDGVRIKENQFYTLYNGQFCECVDFISTKVHLPILHGMIISEKNNISKVQLTDNIGNLLQSAYIIKRNDIYGYGVTYQEAKKDLTRRIKCYEGICDVKSSFILGSIIGYLSSNYSYKDNLPIEFGLLFSISKCLMEANQFYTDLIPNILKNTNKWPLRPCSICSESRVPIYACALGEISHSIGEVRFLADLLIKKLEYGSGTVLNRVEIVAVVAHLASFCEDMSYIRNYLLQNYQYPDFTLSDIKNDDIAEIFNINPIFVAAQAFFGSDSFESAINNAISASNNDVAIVTLTGSFAGLYYDIPDKLKKQALNYLNPENQLLLSQWENLCWEHPYTMNLVLRSENGSIWTVQQIQAKNCFRYYSHKFIRLSEKVAVISFLKPKYKKMADVEQEWILSLEEKQQLISFLKEPYNDYVSNWEWLILTYNRDHGFNNISPHCFNGDKETYEKNTKKGGLSINLSIPDYLLLPDKEI